MSAKVDDEGRFTFGGLAPGTYSVTALVPGKLRVVRGSVAVPAATPLDMVLGAGTKPLEGTVLTASDKTPVKGATVVSGGGDQENLILSSALTNAAGEFSLLAPPANGGMVASAEGFATRFTERRRASGSKPVILLEALGTVRGRVLIKGTEKPVAGIEVTAMPRPNDGPPSLSHAVTDAAGNFVLDDVGPGLVSLVAMGKGYINFDAFSAGRRGPAPAGAVTLKPGGEVESTLFVTEAASATGTVTDASGAPVPGAVVRSGGAMGIGGMMMAMFGGGTLGTTVTDAEGVYVLPEIMPGSALTLTASAPGRADATATGPIVAPGNEARLDLKFAVSRSLLVRVVDAESGEPIAGATAYVQEQQFRMAMGAVTGPPPRTNEQGECVLSPLPAGTLNIRVDAPEHVELRQSAEVGPDQESVTVKLQRGATLSGRLTGPAGVEIGGVRVLLRGTARGPGGT